MVQSLIPRVVVVVEVVVDATQQVAPLHGVDGSLNPQMASRSESIEKASVELP